MTAFFRFPHTPHLAWLGEGTPRGDKVLTPGEARALLAHALVVEEKVDGANLGFSVDQHGVLRAQNRGDFLALDDVRGQWKPLPGWLRVRAERLEDALFPHLVLFGEWCYAVHSVRYTRLPDWFLVFDVYDRASGRFWSTSRRDTLAASLGLAVVPRVGRGRFDRGGLEKLLCASQLTDGPAEGLYLRHDEGDWSISRAKLVRGEFVQAIHGHWSKRRLVPNALAGGPRRGARVGAMVRSEGPHG